MFFCLPSPPRLFRPVALAFALASFLAGCGGGHPHDSEPAVALGANGKPLPVMKAQSNFFDGRLVAEITLSQSRGKGGFKPAPIPGLPSPEESDFGDDDDDIKITPDMIEAIRSRRSESPFPPIVMWLQVTNATQGLLKVDIADFNSDLGNFAVQPDHFTLAPGAVAQPDPVISRLGVTSLEIPVTVTLGLNGKTETHVLVLRPVAGPPPPAVTK
ncbi:MAG: hypothetical protein ABSE59_03910 [Opitutaceae bacterium]|jgi:hypothetical protein